MSAIQTKLKICDKCHTFKLIWKNFEGKRYCKECWNNIKFPIPKSIKKKSDKLKKKEGEYHKVRLEYLNIHQTCEARLPGCTKYATDIHHKKGRGIYLTDVSTFLAVCRTCHNFIELNPETAKQLNLSDNRLN